jgi:hypothetical protein
MSSLSSNGSSSDDSSSECDDGKEIGGWIQGFDMGIGNDVQDLIPQKLINFLEVGPTFLEKSGNLAAPLNNSCCCLYNSGF